MTHNKKPIKLNCPTCGKGVTWDSASPYKPFCSERCRLIDLGAWASEEHKIAGKTFGIAYDDDLNNIDSETTSKPYH